MRLPGQGVGPVTPKLWCAKCQQMKDRKGSTGCRGLFICAECKPPKKVKA